MREITLVVTVNNDEDFDEKVLSRTIEDIFDHGIDNFTPMDSVQEDIADNVAKYEVK